MMASVNFSTQVPLNVGLNSVHQESISTRPSRQTADASAPSRTVSLNPAKPSRPLAFDPNQTFIHSQSTNSNLIADVGQVVCFLGIGLGIGTVSFCAGILKGYKQGRIEGLHDGFEWGKRYKSNGL